MKRMVRSLLVFAFCLNLRGVVYAEDRRYTMKDLQALEKRETWNELIYHIKDIAPSERDAEWNRLLTKACLRDGLDSDLAGACYDELKSVMVSDPKNVDFAWKVGKWSRLNMNSAMAVPFFAKALKPGDARCKDEDVSLAVIAGLGFPTSSAGDKKLVEESQALAFRTCWTAISPALKKTFKVESGYFIMNTCAGLKQKHALSSEEAKKCS